MNNMHDIRNSRKRKAAVKKERIIMLSASAFVLAALTMTGVYVREKNKSNDEYRVDLDELNQEEIAQRAEDIANDLTTIPMDRMTLPDDLDADPYFQETAGTEQIINPQFGNTSAQMAAAAGEKQPKAEAVKVKPEPKPEAVEAPQPSEEPVSEAEETMLVPESDPVTVNYLFPSEQVLHWPSNGEIILNYSMDKTIHFKTLNQYKYNPAVVISAVEGEQITAAANGIVTAVEQTAELGNVLRLDIGDGYELTYGQLCEIGVAPGQSVEAGQVLGKVAAPSIFYSAEGSNLYLKLTHNQVPENPIAYMQ